MLKVKFDRKKYEKKTVKKRRKRKNLQVCGNQMTFHDNDDDDVLCSLSDLLI